MIGGRIFRSLFEREPVEPEQPEIKAGLPVQNDREALSSRLSRFSPGPYFCLADPELRTFSVFDDLKYDRSDLDMVSGPMRRHAVAKLEPLGFKQVTGSILENRDEDVQVLLPKFRALGASPFDATRDSIRRAQDYFLLTPTQAACLIINTYPTETAVEKIKTLIVKHPINLLRILDFLERNDVHQAFKNAIGHLRYVQRRAVESEPLRGMRALR